MSVHLKLPEKFVPATVSEANLKNFNPDIQTEIEETYQRIKAQKFASSVRGTPSVTAIFGSHGTGVRTLMKSLLDETPMKPIVLNAERFAGSLPTFSNKIAALPFILEGANNIEEAAESMMASLSSQYLPAGKYMQDRLMEEALLDGRPVLIAKRGRNAGGIQLLKAINEAGISLHTILYQAPLEIKLEAIAHQEKSSITVMAEQVVAEHQSMIENMKAFAAQSQGLLSVYFRTKDSGKSLYPVASGNETAFSIYDETLAHEFNNCFAANKVTVEDLMKTSERVQLTRPHWDRYAPSFGMAN